MHTAGDGVSSSRTPVVWVLGGQRLRIFMQRHGVETKTRQATADSTHRRIYRGEGALEHPTTHHACFDIGYRHASTQAIDGHSGSRNSSGRVGAEKRD